MRKELMREEIRRLRHSMSPRVREEDMARLLAALEGLPVWGKVRVVGTYYTLPDEVDIMPFNHMLFEKGKIVCMPEVLPNKDMQFRKWSPSAVKKHDWQGVPYPMGEVVHSDKIDVVIIPMLGFDRYGNRLGTGGGYYDRYFDRAEVRKTLKIGVAFACQEVPLILIDDWDRKVNMIVTDKEVIEVM